MPPVISVSHLSKTYAGGRAALKDVSLEIDKGEIFALLGPNGAGKTTLISIICGIVTPSAGKITVDGHDIIRDYRAARSVIGLVPQELTIDFFESVLATIKLSRGLFGKAPDDSYLESLLRELALFDRKDSQARTLSGGMKRRLMIAKALSHEPNILFLDEPTAGVDVELRRGMWDLVRRLRDAGTTIILTTHYLEEAEEMADRIGVIRQGELILVEEKKRLMQKLGQKKLTLTLSAPLAALPASLQDYALSLAEDGRELTYSYSENGATAPIAALLESLNAAGIGIADLRTEQSSLEDIFVSLIGKTS
ncbi:MAG: ABC transporter ATP-binding protein [Methylovirgula sp.]|nr:ABC transporter ATP-binding protein [Methylovirgula sp.]